MGAEADRSWWRRHGGVFAGGPRTADCGRGLVAGRARRRRRLDHRGCGAGLHRGHIGWLVQRCLGRGRRDHGSLRRPALPALGNHHFARAVRASLRRGRPGARRAGATRHPDRDHIAAVRGRRRHPFLVAARDLRLPHRHGRHRRRLRGHHHDRRLLGGGPDQRGQRDRDLRRSVPGRRADRPSAWGHRRVGRAFADGASRV